MSDQGRKPKYNTIIATLDENTLYSPASIANVAKSRGKDRIRIRIALGRMVHNKRHLFPIEGDGEIILGRRFKTAGWHGWRWQEAYNVRKLVSAQNEQK